MANKNCLEGIACPSCGSEGPFDIGVTTVTKVSDDGCSEICGDVEWKPESYCRCHDCGEAANVAAFTLPPLQEYTITVINNNDSPVETFKVSARSEADASKQAAAHVAREWSNFGYDWSMTQ